MCRRPLPTTTTTTNSLKLPAMVTLLFIISVGLWCFFLCRLWRVNSSGLFFYVFCLVSVDFLSLNNPYVIIFYAAIVWVVTTLKIVTAQQRLSHNIPSLGPTLCLTVWLFAHNCKGNSSFCPVINVTVHGMRCTLCREFCGKLVHRREQSVEMCDLYSAALNAFVLFRSYIGSATLSFFPSIRRSLPPCGDSLGASRSQWNDHFRCSSARLQPPSGIFPHLSSHSILSFPPLLSAWADRGLWIKQHLKESIYWL